MKRLLLILLITFSFIACGGDGPTPSNPDIIIVNPDPDDGDGDGGGDGDSGGGSADGTAIPCVNGRAGIYDCNGYDLMSHIELSDMNGSEGNDCWGWTDPSTSKEYALVGLDTGTAFVDISDPVNPVIVGTLRSNTVNSSWRDIKTYGNYAFIVSEAGGHGMQVFDLTKLRNFTTGNPPIVFASDAIYTGFGNAHNIVINEETAFAYVVGSVTFSGGAHIIDISDPLNPTAAGGYGSGGYSHDAQVVVYNGPDPDYAGKEIYIGSNEDEVVIVDVTSKFNPVLISRVSYSNVGYTHQGWLTEDQRFFILGDETDELGVGFNTRTLVFDFIDLDNPTLRREYTGPTRAIDHNGYVKGDEFFLANYTAGVRIIDITNITTMNEVGFFDTYPNSNSAAFAGAWNVYPFFPSGNIIVSDINNGLFVIRKSE